MRHWILSSALVAAAASACGSETANLALIGKCSFAEPASQTLEAGDVFLYAFDEAGAFSVVTGVAANTDDVEDHDARQRMEPRLSARITGGTVDALEFGGLNEAREGTHEHSVGIYARDGAANTSLGTTYGTQNAYPICAFW